MDKSLLPEEVLSIIHLCACQAMDTDDLEKVERLEKEAAQEIAKLLQSAITEAKIEGKAELLTKGTWQGNGWFVSVAFLHPALQKKYEDLKSNREET